MEKTIAFNESMISGISIKDNNIIATITFPNNSKYAGYVWKYPFEDIYFNIEENINDSAYSFNPEKCWIRVNSEFRFLINNGLDELDQEYKELYLDVVDLKEQMKTAIQKYTLYHVVKEYINVSGLDLYEFIDETNLVQKLSG